MSEKKVRYIPKVEYIDSPPEVSFIPIDEFILFALATILMFWFGYSLIAIPVGVGAAWWYKKFKENKPKNFYQTIPYELGIVRYKSVPPVVTDEFCE